MPPSRDGRRHGVGERVTKCRRKQTVLLVGRPTGTIGRNGAGKSTLLKVLSRITDPTEGKGCIRGSASSLREVGTGFHVELTGIENIYLSAAIHGMRKHGVDRAFGRIVEFSGVEQFQETPVKRYSSGMHMRLGFAVSAYIEPDVLLVGDVLRKGRVGGSGLPDGALPNAFYDPG